MRRTHGWLLIGLLVLSGALAPAARADAPLVTYSIWTLEGPMVRLRYLLPTREAQRLSGTPVMVLAQERLSSYLLSHLSVQAGGRDCPATRQGFGIGKIDPLAVDNGLYGFEIFFQCPDDSPRVLYDRAYFGHFPRQQNFARVQIGQGFVQRLFTAGHEQVSVSAASPRALRSAGLGAYLPLGIAHTLRSADWLCVLLGLLLLVRNRQDFGWLAGSLALGYGLSLAGVTAYWVLPRPAGAAAVLGLLVALLAAALVSRELQRPGRVAAACAAVLVALGAIDLLVHAGDETLLCVGAAAFAASLLPVFDRRLGGWPPWTLIGLIAAFLDGFVLVGRVAPLQLQPPELRPMLLGFDLGALLVSLAMLLAVALAVRALQRRRLTLPRALLHDLAAAGLGGVGLYWLVSRL